MGTVDTIASWNVHSMLTGQMDQYFAAPVGEWINPETGTRVYTEQEDYDNARKNEQAVYEWFCNWLNTMDFGKPHRILYPGRWKRIFWKQ